MTFDELREIGEILKDEFEDPYFRDNNVLFRVMDGDGNMYSSIEELKKHQKGNKK